MFERRFLNQLPRSNNSLEGLQNALRSSVTCQHPSIWKLIDALEEESIALKKKVISKEEIQCDIRIKMQLSESWQYERGIILKTK